MSAEILGVAGMIATLLAHIASTVWWAATLTKRVEHIERWITHNGHTAERLASVETQIKSLSAGIGRIERYLIAEQSLEDEDL